MTRKPEFYSKKLDNGITVLFEKRYMPVIAVASSVKFGAQHESEKVKGISHFIEHLVFKGTKKRSVEEIPNEVESKGGIINAFTSEEITCYWNKLPSKHFSLGADITRDLVLNPLFEKNALERERKVILEEIKMYRDDPQKHVFELIERAMFEKPFGEGIIGSEETIKKMDRNFVFDYYRKHYSPENYIVTIVGDCDFDNVCGYLENNFDKIGGRYENEKIVKKNGEMIEEREGIDQANFIFAVHAPLAGTKEYYMLNVLDAYLADGMSSRLFLEIREKRGLAYAIKSSIIAEKDYSYYLIYAGTTKESVNDVRKIILEEFSKISEMKEKDLKEAKERVIGLKKIESEESSGVMNTLLFTELVIGAEEYYKYDNKIRDVKLEDVKKLAKELVKEYSVAMVLPK